MRLSTLTIQDLKQRITPTEAIERYTGIQGRRGRYLCPFHNDTHPSISVKGNRWTCWSCGASGDIIDFTRGYFGLSFREAVAKLGSDFNVPVEAAEGNAGNQTTDPASGAAFEAMAERISYEAARNNRKEYREYLAAEIEKLSTAHRVLMKQGAAPEVLLEYEDLIDRLILEID